MDQVIFNDVIRKSEGIFELEMNLNKMVDILNSDFIRVQRADLEGKTINNSIIKNIKQSLIDNPNEIKILNLAIDNENEYVYNEQDKSLKVDGYLSQNGDIELLLAITRLAKDIEEDSNIKLKIVISC